MGDEARPTLSNRAPVSLERGTFDELAQMGRDLAEGNRGAQSWTAHDCAVHAIVRLLADEANRA